MVEATKVQNQAVLKSLVSLAVSLVVMGLALFISAGTLNWARGWWFFGLFLVATLIAIAVLWRLNPEIFAARSRVQPGTKRGDYIFIVVVIGAFILVLPV